MPVDPSTAELSRALYEHSPMPVRDIAALHGVCERSVYRYAARHNWRRRCTRLAIWQQTFREEAPAEKSRMKLRTHGAAEPDSEFRRSLVARGAAHAIGRRSGQGAGRHSAHGAPVRGVADFDAIKLLKFAAPEA